MVGYATDWSTSFAPPVFPTAGFITDDGRFVAVVVGYLPQSEKRNAVAIFGPGGALLRAMALKDMFSVEEESKLARSVSGIPWVGTAELIRKTATLRIVTNNPFPKPPRGAVLSPSPLIVTLLISLPTGRITRVADGA